MPKGYKFGRIFDNKGFDKINNRGLVKVFDLCSKLFCMVDASEVVNPKFITPGTSVDNIWLYCYNNIVYTSRNALFENNKHLPQTNGGPLLPSAKVPECHWNQTPARNQFSQENAGKTYAEIGIAVISAKDYNFNEKEIYVRRR